MQDAKICFMYDFFGDNEFALFNLDRFRRATAGFGDFVPVYHKRGSATIASGVQGVINLTDEEIFDGIKHHKNNNYRIIPGNCDLKVLAAWRRLPGYDFYILIEYDVVFLGDARSAIERLVSSAMKADLCASYFCTAYKNEWMWWDSLAAPEGSSIDLKSVATSAFLPLMSFSNRFAKAATARLAQGWQGHYEALWPTIAALDGLTMLDFANTQPQLTSHAQFSHKPEAVSLGEARYAHPIKSKAQFADLLSRAGIPTDESCV